MTQTEELEGLIAGMIGRPFVAGDVMYGSLRKHDVAERMKKEDEALHHRVARDFGRQYCSEVKKPNDESQIGLVNR